MSRLVLWIDWLEIAVLLFVLVWTDPIRLAFVNGLPVGWIELLGFVRVW